MHASLPTVVSRFELLPKGILLPLLHVPDCFCMIRLGSGGGGAAAAANVRGAGVCLLASLLAPEPRSPALHSSPSAQDPSSSAADSSLVVYQCRIRVYQRRVRVCGAGHESRCGKGSHRGSRVWSWTRDYTRCAQPSYGASPPSPRRCPLA